VEELTEDRCTSLGRSLVDWLRKKWSLIQAGVQCACSKVVAPLCLPATRCRTCSANDTRRLPLTFLHCPQLQGLRHCALLRGRLHLQEVRAHRIRRRLHRELSYQHLQLVKKSGASTSLVMFGRRWLRQAQCGALIN